MGAILLVIEFALVLASVVVAIGQGWDQVVQPLQVLAIFIIMTILSLMIGEFCNDYEEKEKQHPGTHHEIRT